MSKNQSTLLFIHGWATDGLVWEQQVIEYKNLYKCHNISLPGHGGNEKWDTPDLEPPVKEVLNHLLSSKLGESSSDGVTGIGWSLGAQVLLTLAMERKMKFNGLVLIGATPCFVKKDDFPWAQPMPVVKKMIKEMKKNPHETIKRFYNINFARDELNTGNAKKFMDQYASHNASFKFNEIITGLETISKIDLRDQLYILDVPVLIIHGEMDQVCPVGAAHFLAEKIKGAELKIFEKAGHAPFFTETEKFNKLVKDFICKILN